ncbi:MAG TPA: bifunctional 3,4-dihydroxy-2-butanone-4-phosphate synthase/GTP cyclohydrolase II [Zeimonas sp.]|nr:bifunctional 3,4-dihydroxy-2-butanone-4-phosphate synthase/GTP cyclohydrolase II [Zeimonas sp.]
MTLSSTPEIIAELAAGRMVILVDEEDRENEGDLVLAADFVTPEAINFMARYGRGLICLTLTEERCRQLRLPRMVDNNLARHGTNFTVSIEAAEGVSTGISAADRARTVQAAVAPDAKPEDVVQPGHIFPLMAQPGGVLMRAGHTEAGCDLARLAGCTPAAVICEILRDDGSMARLPDLIEFAARHGLKIGAIADLIQYRSAHDSLIERVAERAIDSRWGPLTLVAYRDLVAGSPHLALVHGEVDRESETLVRVHEPLSLIDLLDRGARLHSWPLDRAMARIVEQRAGVAVLLNCAQPPAALFDELRALDEESASARARRRSGKLDLRTYGIGAQILKDLGVGRMRLLSQPRKMPSMTGYELEVVGFESIEEGL